MDPRTNQAEALMSTFAERTGIRSAGPSRRYLWTDAFAVCNFIGLSRITGGPHHRELALALADRVHHVLGRHRPDDRRTGWISGLDEQAGQAHPTLGGLRIGKPLPERLASEPFDDQLEWDRDGQYFHYLTKWMHALDRLARATDQRRYAMWARELADTAVRRFTHDPASRRGRRLCWKMSIDLSRPLVPSMGQHDPLDGLLTCVELEVAAATRGTPLRGPDLKPAISDLASMIEPRALVTTDPLGLGGLLVDLERLARLGRSAGRLVPARLLDAVALAAAIGLQHYVAQSELDRPAGLRIAFRELGLAIGLAALPLVDRSALGPEARTTYAALERYAGLGRQIEEFWRVPQHRVARSWTEHQDINDVMLATALVPDGFLRSYSGDETRAEIAGVVR